ncbi:hypothetical protein PDE_01670 [Penicillium oxalicum 114-2]|uniref:Uncharacterized protein n=1 Tax=Penicillium oxalicum (strain 114-2 / CGMCC 5302) TaxID=933388 RepID=S8AXR9_PENO1|nr:hypothetical protein PDE_01670 [Penicillium oxalicum 114-2]
MVENQQSFLISVFCPFDTIHMSLGLFILVQYVTINELTLMFIRRWIRIPQLQSLPKKKYVRFTMDQGHREIMIKSSEQFLIPDALS